MVWKIGLKLLDAFGFDVFAIQSNFVTVGVASMLNVFIISSLLKLLSIVEVISANSY